VDTTIYGTYKIVAFVVIEVLLAVTHEFFVDDIVPPTHMKDVFVRKI
jgi:hypothetical protein